MGVSRIVRHSRRGRIIEMTETQKRLCSAEGCDRAYYSRGYCRAHKARLDRNGEVFPGEPIKPPPAKGVCSVDGCAGVRRSAGMCAKHYREQFQQGKRANGDADPCVENGCDRPVRSRGLCSAHYARLMTTGTTSLVARPKRERARIARDGYVLLHRPEHPNSGSARGYIAEHRLVMSEYLGRALLAGENVHHINGVRDDNRIENLELWSTWQPSGQRVSDKVSWAIEFLGQYSPESLSQSCEVLPE